MLSRPSDSAPTRWRLGGNLPLPNGLARRVVGCGYRVSVNSRLVVLPAASLTLTLRRWVPEVAARASQ